jgi:hypothetical protein
MPQEDSKGDGANVQPTIQTQATQLMGQIPFGAIIGAPLMAAVSAQGAAAQACLDFLKSAGFDKDGNVSNTTFSFQTVNVPADAEARAREELKLDPLPAVLDDASKRRVEEQIAKNTTRVATRLDVPTLSLLPVPFIRIDDLTVAMKVNVTATTETGGTRSNSQTIEGKADGTLGWGPLKVGFTGGISSKKDSTATSTSKYSVEQTIDVNIHATQDDMPAGLAKVLNILVDSIRAVPQG